MTVSDRIVEFRDGQLVMLRDQIVGFDIDSSYPFTIKAVTNGGGEVYVESFSHSYNGSVWRETTPDEALRIRAADEIGEAESRRRAAERFHELTMLLAGETP